MVVVLDDDPVLAVLRLRLLVLASLLPQGAVEAFHLALGGRLLEYARVSFLAVDGNAPFLLGLERVALPDFVHVMLEHVTPRLLEFGDACLGLIAGTTFHHAIQ